MSYIPLGGRIYELDGLKRGPVDHGPAGEDWTEAVRPVIEARMQKYQQGEIHFNLMALIQVFRYFIPNPATHRYRMQRNLISPCPYFCWMQKYEQTTSP